MATGALQEGRPIDVTQSLNTSAGAWKSTLLRGLCFNCRRQSASPRRPASLASADDRGLHAMPVLQQRPNRSGLSQGAFELARSESNRRPLSDHRHIGKDISALVDLPADAATGTEGPA